MTQPSGLPAVNMGAKIAPRATMSTPPGAIKYQRQGGTRRNAVNYQNRNANGQVHYYTPGQNACGRRTELWPDSATPST